MVSVARQSKCKGLLEFTGNLQATRVASSTDWGVFAEGR